MGQDLLYGIPMDTTKEITAAYVGIGNELLSGSTRDENFFYLARCLHELGIQLMRCFVIPDEQDVIRETIERCRGRFTYVFTSGGLGPTHDDVTVEGVALALGVPVVRHPFLEKKIREFYGDRLEEASLKMAEVPQGAALHLPDRMSFPVLSIENIYLFPGIPELFQQKFEAIKERFRTRPYHTREILSDRPESEIADLLSEALERFPSIRIGSYPQWGEKGYRVKVVVEGKDEDSVAKAAAHLQKVLA
jgi:molybdenum cofactor synthesis domain-containing protein